MFEIILSIIGIGLIAYALLLYGKRNHGYFKKIGLKYVEPYPFVGNNGWIFLGKRITDVLSIGYDAYPKERIVGMFDFGTPVFFIRDPKLVKQITIKDFDYFVDRRSFAKPEDDELFGHALISMKGQKWREMRAALSPAFTGRKMRLMFILIANICKQMVDHFNEDFQKNKKPTSYDIKDLLSRYTNDVIASCAFGIQVDSIKDPENDFYKVGQSFLNFAKPSMMVKFILLTLVPKLTRIFDIGIIDMKRAKMFKKIILEQMRTREENNIVRPDMINLLMQLRKGTTEQVINEEDEVDESEMDESSKVVRSSSTKTKWSDAELVAQCFLFFLGGFETTSTFLQFLFYEITLNVDVQKKLIDEIDECREDLENEPMTYEFLHKLNYLDMVVNEALRKWTPAFVADRTCVKDYKVTKKDGTDFVMEKGSIVQIPIYSFHHDPNYFPDPEKFDPERFSEENKKFIDPDTYTPFGQGPRNCIGSRFALMEIKALLFYVLSEFTLEVCEETPLKLELKKSVFALAPVKKIKVAFKPRNWQI